MAKFFGKLGYGITEETKPGVWEDVVIERDVRGDLMRASRALENSNYLNDNININNSFSIVADPFALQNFQNILYLKWNGVRWVVKTVEIEYPRLILSVGNVYNGPVPEDGDYHEN